MRKMPAVVGLSLVVLGARRPIRIWAFGGWPLNRSPPTPTGLARAAMVTPAQLRFKITCCSRRRRRQRPPADAFLGDQRTDATRPASARRRERSTPAIGSTAYSTYSPGLTYEIAKPREDAYIRVLTVPAGTSPPPWCSWRLTKLFRSIDLELADRSAEAAGSTRQPLGPMRAVETCSRAPRRSELLPFLALREPRCFPATLSMFGKGANEGLVGSRIRRAGNDASERRVLHLFTVGTPSEP